MHLNLTSKQSFLPQSKAPILELLGTHMQENKIIVVYYYFNQ
jgi:hypothetical protein